MTLWFRSWHGAPTDPKWVLIARRAGCAPAVASAIAWALFDHASQASPRGSVAGFDAEVYAAWGGLDDAVVVGAIKAMTDRGMIVDGALANWAKRQPEREDNSAERAKAWRENKRIEANAKPEARTQTNAAERDQTQRDAPEKRREDTEQKVEASSSSEPVQKLQPLPDQATPEPGDGINPVDVGRQKKPNKRHVEYPPGFIAFWSGYPTDANMSKIRAFNEWGKLDRAAKDIAIASLTGFNAYCLSHKDYRPVHAERYLKDQRFEGHAEAAGRLKSVAGVYVKADTPQWRAWEAHYRRGGRSPPVDARGGWRFPTEYPPREDARMSA